LPQPEEKYKPYAYFWDEIPHIISAAELIICRGGAGTIWECASLKKPMIIIPLRASGASRGDQVENAGIFEKAGAAVHFNNESESGDNGNMTLSTMAKNLASLASGLAEKKKKRKAMVASVIGETNAAEYIAKAVAQRVK
jgi:UDP-N-acetylglucosamine--N-acetylmuramyl-(pentapeptide) pyrophosphoryl-undecaprenol N-acetylglucosamine transferase